MEDDLTKVAQDSARGGFFLVSSSATATVIFAITSILIARFLGPELYGQYALAIVVPELLYLFTDLGLNQAIIKFTATLKSKNETDQIPVLIRHGIVARTIIGIAIFALNYVFADVIALHLLQRPELSFYIQIASLAILFQVIFTAATAVFVGLDKTEYQVVTENTRAIAKAIVSITLILAGFGVIGATMGYTASFIISAIVALPLLWLLLHKYKKSNKNHDFKNNFKMLFQYGSPLYISILIVGFLPLFKNLILAFFASDAEIGNYKAAINFGALLLVLAGPITTILLPAFSKLEKTSGQKIRYFFKIALKYTSLIMIPVASLIILFSAEIVQIIYGSTYQLAPVFLSTHVLLYLLAGIGYLTLQSFYSGLGKTKTTLVINIITFCTLVILSIPLTETYGVQGIIVAFIIAHFLGTFYGAYVAKKNYHIEFDFKNIAKIYIISVLSSVFPLLLKNFTNLPNEFILAFGSVIYVIAFITLMPLANLISMPELQRITLAITNTPLLRQLVNPIIKYQEKILELKTSFESRKKL